ncbi:helix-turn-helix domain-containing protein [Lutimaribacter marinistellae]|uniref:Helix-turn-helix domain-containing protein n=1 Tax=Lutimaribacter marinistellae TaxID=1820329 RepID=A0ABV7TGH7_9RHOB
MPDEMTGRLAGRLRELRGARGWSLEQLAEQSGVSRATLSRLENGEVSPTAETLGRLCAVHGLPMSRLLMMVEDSHTAHVRREDQALWTDPATGYVRRAVSPPARGLAAEVMEGRLPAGAVITYDAPPRPGQEHHLVLLEGALRLSFEDRSHDLGPGDCLRYHLSGPNRFEAGEAGARYLLVLL